MNKTRRLFSLRKWTLFYAAGAFFLFLSGCVSRPPVLSPPTQLESLEGYGSLSVRGAERSGRARFSFMMKVNGVGRIEVLNPFGKSLYHIIFRQENSYLVVPSKKIYWEGSAGEVAEKFLGFDLRAAEISCLLSGRWDGCRDESGIGAALNGWRLERDRQNRVVRGERDGFIFEVKEFFAGTPVPRQAAYADASGKGKIKILKIRFNTPLRESALALSFLEEYEPKTWAEMESLLDHED